MENFNTNISHLLHLCSQVKAEVCVYCELSKLLFTSLLPLRHTRECIPKLQCNLSNPGAHGA
jgi:hypothetical protein